MNKLLPSTQSRLRSSVNTATALMDLTDDTSNNTDAGRITILVNSDYSQAFDTINRNLLLAIIQSMGISESIFNNYLLSRSQRVLIRLLMGYLNK